MNIKLVPVVDFSDFWPRVHEVLPKVTSEAISEELSNSDITFGGGHPTLIHPLDLKPLILACCEGLYEMDEASERLNNLYQRLGHECAYWSDLAIALGN